MIGLWHAIKASDVAYRLGWTLLHSIWLGAAVAALLATTSLLLRRRSANARYLAACAALALMVALSASTYFLVPPRSNPASTRAQVPGSPQELADHHEAIDARFILNPATTPPPAMSADSTSRLADTPTRLIVPIVSPRPIAPWIKLSKTLEPALPWLAAAWAIGVLALAFWQSSAWLASRRIRRMAIVPQDDALRDTLTRVAKMMRVFAGVELLESARVNVPTLIGWLSPVILLPVGLASGLTSSQLRAILAHELAHIRRHDYLVNLLQTLAETLFFYHPAAWYISGQMRAERENCCDDAVIALGTEPLTYAESLLCVARRALAGSGMLADVPVLALGAVGKPSELRRRIRRVLDGAELRRGAVGSWPAVVLVIGVVLAAGLFQTGRGSNISHAADSSLPAATAPASRPTPKATERAAKVAIKIESDRVAFAAGEDVVLGLAITNLGTAEIEAPSTYWATRAILDGKEYKRLPMFIGNWNGAGVILPKTEYRTTTSLLEYGITPLILVPGRHKVVMRIGDDVSNELTLVVRPAALKPPEWGEPKDGLRTRFSAEKQTFRAGEPIPVKVELENVSDQVKDHSILANPYNHTFSVVDEQRREAPYIGGLAQVQQPRGKLNPGQSSELSSFDLATWFYLRRPGRYTARFPGKPASATFEFDVTADPVLAAADGDPVGRLLPLVKDRWWLSGGSNQPTKLQPGANRGQATGRLVSLYYSPTGYKGDSGLVWLWLTDEPAAEQPVTGKYPPSSEYVGKVDRWHVYISVDANARKAWPTAKDDIKKALADEQETDAKQRR